MARISDVERGKELRHAAVKLPSRKDLIGSRLSNLLQTLGVNMRTKGDNLSRRSRCRAELGDRFRKIDTRRTQVEHHGSGARRLFEQCRSRTGGDERQPCVVRGSLGARDDHQVAAEQGNNGD